MVKKYKITKEQRIIIEDLNDIINKPGKIRFDNEKRKALEEMVLLHNDIFGTSYEKSNVSCPGCIKRVKDGFNKLIDSWQINRK